MYNCNNVNFCLFDLKKGNKFVIFSSPKSSDVTKLIVEGSVKTKAIQNCFMRLPSEEANNADSLRSFGEIFELAEEKACQLQVGGKFNSGNYLVSISKKIDSERKKLMPDLKSGWSWWEGSVVITFKPIGATNK